MMATILDLPPLQAVRTCQHCRWFMRGAPDGGFCRRLPPTAFFSPRQTALGRIEMDSTSQFPMVRSDWWCGEWGGKLGALGPVQEPEIQQIET